MRYITDGSGVGGPRPATTRIGRCAANNVSLAATSLVRVYRNWRILVDVSNLFGARRGLGASSRRCARLAGWLAESVGVNRCAGAHAAQTGQPGKTTKSPCQFSKSIGNTFSPRANWKMFVASRHYISVDMCKLIPKAPKYRTAEHYLGIQSFCIRQGASAASPTLEGRALITAGTTNNPPP